MNLIFCVYNSDMYNTLCITICVEYYQSLQYMRKRMFLLASSGGISTHFFPRFHLDSLENKLANGLLMFSVEVIRER